jgi:NodT family efflux transporter outer membrane factor (OMF) lipoprotein
MSRKSITSKIALLPYCLIALFKIGRWTLSVGCWMFVFIGCAARPDKPLMTPAPAPSMATVPASTNARERAERPLPQEWWTAFRDPELDRLIARAREQNRNLAQASARIEAAQAAARIVGADSALQVSGSANAIRSRNSENSVASSFLSPYQTRLGASLQFAYEADLWGRIRALREAAVKNVELSVSERATAEIALCAEVAKAYLSRLAIRRETGVLDRQLVAYNETEKLQTIRADAGFATDLDSARTRIEVATREGERAALREREQALGHALDLLCGDAAAPGGATNTVPAEAFAPEVPETLSLALLEERPDVAAKRVKWEAAVQRVHAARMARYPALTLSGRIGTEADSLSDLLDWRSRLWSIAAGLTAPILDGGKLAASLDLERAGLSEAAAGYEAAVLTAYREVADALNTLHALVERQRAAEAGREASRRAISLSRERYDKGFVTYLEVIESERSLLTAERTLVQLQAGRQTATVDLIRALGIP